MLKIFTTYNKKTLFYTRGVKKLYSMQKKAKPIKKFKLTLKKQILTSLFLHRIKKFNCSGLLKNFILCKTAKKDKKTIKILYTTYKKSCFECIG